MSLQSAFPFVFDFLRKMPIVVETSDAMISSDAGLLAIWQFDERRKGVRILVGGLGDLDRLEEKIAQEQNSYAARDSSVPRAGQSIQWSNHCGFEHLVNCRKVSERPDFSTTSRNLPPSIDSTRRMT